MRIARVVSGLIAVLFMMGSADAQGTRVKPLTPEDYAEIQQLYVVYAWAIDTRADGGMAYARTFTPDGVFDNATAKEQFVGHAQIAALNTRTNNGRPSAAPTHFTTNIVIEPSPEGARGAAYLIVTAGGSGAPPTVPAIGTYKDVLVKTPEGWRFKRRTLYLNAMPPSQGE